MKKILLLFVLLSMQATMLPFFDAQAWEPRLRHLRQLDVGKNVEQLLQLKRCRFCYLRGANLKGYDLWDADFTGADLSDVIWMDGRKCRVGSIGKCLPPKEEGQQ